MKIWNMDLGSPNLMFRNLYVTQPLFGTMPRFMDRSGAKVSDLKNAAQIISNLRPISFSVSQYAKKEVGFSAAELIKVLPDLVEGSTTEGYSIDYVSLIPYLVQALKEEQEKRAELEKEIAAMQKTIKTIQQTLKGLVPGTGKSNSAPLPEADVPQEEITTASTCRLFQNAPNPFSSATVIRYELANNGDNACIHISNTNGRLLRSIALPAAGGKGQIQISAGDFIPGIYTYSLIVSDKVVDSKRMVVTQ